MDSTGFEPATLGDNASEVANYLHEPEYVRLDKTKHLPSRMVRVLGRVLLPPRMIREDEPHLRKPITSIFLSIVKLNLNPRTVFPRALVARMRDFKRAQTVVNRRRRFVAFKQIAHEPVVLQRIVVAHKDEV